MVQETDITLSEKFKEYALLGFYKGEDFENWQTRYRFPNGYGASVVRNDYSYGREEGLCEIAVLKFDGFDWELCYDTPITDDVIGWLDAYKRDKVLEDIMNLPSDKPQLEQGN